MNWRIINTIIRKDLRVVSKSKAVIIPLILLPLILQVLMPVGIGLAVTLVPESDVVSDAGDFDQMLAAMPQSVRDEFDDMTAQQQIFVLMLVYFFAPMYLIVPLFVASVIAADSFAGERERKTMEALLHTPATDTELIVGKLLTAWLPAVAIAVLAFVLYGVAINAVGWPLMGRIFFPNALWLVLVLWVAPAASAVGLGATVLISSRVNTFQEAYQLGSVVVVPVVALVLGQAGGILFLGEVLAAVLGLILWLAAILLLALSIGLFRRSEMIARL